MSWKLQPAKYLHVELSTYCNASCPLCLRFYEGTDVVRPDLELQSMTLENFKKYFPEDFVKGLRRVLYCGTMGDPIMAKECYEIVEYVTTLNPKCEQRLHTNGGTRNKDFWKKLGKLFSKTNQRVIFSIDGLEDTNHIYRRNVNWKKLMSNVTTYIEAGGCADWEFLIFGHNEHQIEEAKKMSKDLGFANFLPKRAAGFDDRDNGGTWPRMVFDSEGVAVSKLYPPMDPKYQNINDSGEFHDRTYNINVDDLKEAQVIRFFPKIDLKVQQFKDSDMSDMLGSYGQQLNEKKIQCSSLQFGEFSEIYVNAGGILFPCCFTGTRYDSIIDSPVDTQLKSKINKCKPQLDLNKNNINELLSSEILDKTFADTWDLSFNEGKIALCSETCGKGNWVDKLYVKD